MKLSIRIPEASVNTSSLVEAVTKNYGESESVVETIFSTTEQSNEAGESKTSIFNLDSDKEEELSSSITSDAISKAVDAALGQEAYNGNVSVNTDRTSTFKENINASTDFFNAYGILLDTIKDTTISLTKAQNAQIDKLAKMSDKLNSGNYIMTDDIKKATNTANEIVASINHTKVKSETENKNSGHSILVALKAIISNDENIKENKSNNKLTKKEYEEIKNNFNTNDDIAAANSEIIDTAEKYGIYLAA